jgi:hypothetical protein
MNIDNLISALLENKVSYQEDIKLYEKSFVSYETTKLIMVRLDSSKYILAIGKGELYTDLTCIQDKPLSLEYSKGLSQGIEWKLCDLTHENRLVLNKYFDFTVPKAFGKNIATMGLGDRLGLASPGHIKAVQGKDIKPILCQQSIRELSLTERTYEDVLDSACFAVFQEGYRNGFGADGDHLKEEKHIEMALNLGFTMITLDCSEKIDNNIVMLNYDELNEKYNQIDESTRNYFEEKYLDKTFILVDTVIFFDKEKLMQNVLVYNQAIEFIDSIYKKYIKGKESSIDFEISIDETSTPTAPHAHYFVAKELSDNGININSMAPRFCGEFQKGIDYIGSLGNFEDEFIIHSSIADFFGYKLSIHSGSDKFSVFPIIGKLAKGRYHVKTAGTNWLEAVRVIAKVNPELYKRMHSYALEHFDEAKVYYHVTTDLSKIQPIEGFKDSELVQYMEDNNARQLMHITYGLLLTARLKNDKLMFRDEIYKTLIDNEETYEMSLINHIGKHIKLLGK